MPPQSRPKPRIGIRGLRTTSWVKCEQILTISKDRLKEIWGNLSPKDMRRVELAVRTVLSL